MMKKKHMLGCALVLCVVLLTTSFSDVQDTDWYFEPVTEMTQLGYLKGYEDGSFAPDAQISGAEFVTIAARVKGLTAETAVSSHWAGGLLQAALSQGWYDYDELPPTAQTYDLPITRQLAVKVLMHAFDRDAGYDFNQESAKINDFDQLNGRYYNTTLAAYAMDLVEGDQNGNFNPLSGLTRAEASAIIARAIHRYGGTSPAPAETPAPVQPPQAEYRKGGVSENGKLQVIGTQLSNENGEPIILKGMSSHGIHWFPQFVSADAIKATADRGANVFRLAMYTAENGYISNQSIKNTLITAVDDAINQDMYVIIDWHILSDGNPNQYKDEAKAFFVEMANRYRDNPAVLYEICNEPNGSVTWDQDVEPYANEIIAAIRAIDDNAVVLVGSPTWSQDLDKITPLAYDNIMYTCHFYAGTHTGWLRDRITAVMAKGIPVFVSEWGTSDASGSGGVFLSEAQGWVDFLQEKGISWVNWSLCDKNESSAALNQGANPADGWSEDELTESGKFIFGKFQ